MIAAIKQAIAIYTNDPEWARVRPPLVELTTGQARLLGAELKRVIGFAMTESGTLKANQELRNRGKELARKFQRRTQTPNANVQRPTPNSQLPTPKPNAKVQRPEVERSSRKRAHFQNQEEERIPKKKRKVSIIATDFQE